jgi:hypothetical protein
VSLLTFLLVLVVAGFLLWLVTTYIPMEPTIKKVVIAIAVIALCLWALNMFGLLSSITNIRVGRVR